MTLDMDVTAVEREICRIPEVRATRIVSDEGGRPVEVHVLATPEKHAKQLVRDIQSVAIASFGLDLDRRIISVVQLGEGAMPTSHGDDDIAHAPGEPRIIVEGVTAAKEGLDATVVVTLTRGNEKVTGEAKGSVATSATLRLVAQATLQALRQMEPAAHRVDVETATIVRFGDRAVAVTSVVLVVPPYEEIVSGSAIVRTAGDHDAMARAVLDATNRRLHQLT